MKRTTIFLLVLVLLVSGKAFSQSSADASQRVGLETELIQPFLPEVGIIRLTGSRPITTQSKFNGDLLLGMYIRPNVKHDVVEKINEYMLVLGYRRFLWNELHLEAKSNMGYAWGTRNRIDGKNYETPTWFWEANVGYKVKVTSKEKSSLYVIPQFGAIGKIIGDIGPRGGKPDNFIQGNLIFGINF